jgi:hypothetical protein
MESRTPHKQGRRTSPRTAQPRIMTAGRTASNQNRNHWLGGAWFLGSRAPKIGGGGNGADRQRRKKTRTTQRTPTPHQPQPNAPRPKDLLLPADLRARLDALVRLDGRRARARVCARARDRARAAADAARRVAPLRQRDAEQEVVERVDHALDGGEAVELHPGQKERYGNMERGLWLGLGRISRREALSEDSLSELNVDRHAISRRSGVRCGILRTRQGASSSSCEARSGSRKRPNARPGRRGAEAAKCAQLPLARRSDGAPRLARLTW